MSSLRDQLWPVFIEEVSEQIDELESLLDAASHADAGADVHVLFRHFHTVKSNGSMMDFQSIEHLAHASEDMLFVLRENNLCVDAGCVALLVRCVDALKQQLDYVTRFRTNPPEAVELIAELAAQAESQKISKTRQESSPTPLEPVPDALTLPEQDEETMRINTHTLDDLVASVGNMAMRENRFSHALFDESTEVLLGKAKSILARFSGDRMEEADRHILRELLATLDDTHSKSIHADQSIQAALTHIEQDVLDLRVVPIAIVFNRLPLLVNKTADQANKQVKLIMEGSEVRIDKRMVDTLMEPLVHIIRNAIDHGIESPAERQRMGKHDAGQITVRAEQDSGMLLLEIMDDGKGLDADRIVSKARTMGLITADHVFNTPEQIYQLIFLPGFSTAETVTETSGRGVGMDVVKTRMTALGGRVDVQSSPGKGTRFRLQLPLSVAIQTVLLVRLQEQVYALALRSVSEIIPALSEQIQTTCGQSVLLFRDEVLPVASLSSLIGFDQFASSGSARHHEIVIIRRQDEWLGLLVDEVIGQQELIVREVHSDLAGLPGLGGVSLLADGRVVIILDGDHLLNASMNTARSLEALS